MAHKQQMLFIEIVAKHLNQDGYAGWEILEIGSYDVNGSVRKCFAGSSYTGVDLVDGPGVDLICAGENLAFEDAKFDLSLSCECFEHNPKWIETFRNMCRVTKKGGVVIVTVATTGRIEHGTRRTTPKSSPGTQEVGWDYYKNLTKKDFQNSFDLKSIFYNYLFIKNKASCDLYFVGIKRGNDVDIHFDSRYLINTNHQKQALLKQQIKDERGISRMGFSYPKKIILNLDDLIKTMVVNLLKILPERCFQDAVLKFDVIYESIKIKILPFMQRIFNR